MSRATLPPKKRGVILDPIKIKRAQRVLGTTTEKETIDRALDEIVKKTNETGALGKRMKPFQPLSIHAPARLKFLSAAIFGLGHRCDVAE